MNIKDEVKAADAEAKAQADKETADAAADDSAAADKEITDNELDLDKELEAERKRGTPDRKRAQEAFRERQGRKPKESDEADDEEKDDAEKPLTRADLAEIEERAYQRAQGDRAREIAVRLGQSGKEADLIFEKWRNRRFPAGMTLDEQLSEAYAITHSKRIIGERNEALRALATKDTARQTAAETHRDGQSEAEPKIPENDKAAMKASGFEWDATKRMYKKSLGRRGFLYRDPKSGKTFPAAS